jgi:hypothetical protein
MTSQDADVMMYDVGLPIEQIVVQVLDTFSKLRTPIRTRTPVLQIRRNVLLFVGALVFDGVGL